MDVHVEEANGERIVRFSGELTIQYATEIKEALTGALAGAHSVLLDVGYVTNTDIACLQVFCAAHQAAVELNIPLALDEKRSLAFVNTMRDAGFARHTGCSRGRGTRCLWQNETCI